jgi:hypothetical protein
MRQCRLKMDKFVIPKDFNRLVSMINPDSFIADMISIGELRGTKGNYSDDCRFLCNNAVAWILGKLSRTIYIYEIKVVEGHFVDWEHTWIEAGDYYLDLCLAQFEQCPKIAISRIGEVKGYIPERSYNPFDWAKKQIMLLK